MASINQVSIEFTTKGERQVAQALKDVGRSVENVTRSQVTASQAASRLEAQRQKETRALEQLRRKYVEGYAAMEIYSRELNDLARARQANIISAEQQRAEVERLNVALKNGTLGMQNFGGAHQFAGRNISKAGVITQQAGYQIGDFLVQVQSGTNWMVAFGQQATQVVGTMTLLGGKFIAIGTVLGIAIPLLTAVGAAFMRTRKEIEETTNSLEDYRNEVENLRLGISSQEREYVDQIAAQKVALQEAIEQLRIRQEIVERQGEDAEYFSQREREAVEAARESLELAKERYSEFLRLREEAERLKNLQELTNQELQVGASLISDYSDEAEKIREAYEDLADEIGDAATQALILAGVDITSGVDSAAKAAAILASQLGIALGFAKSIQSIGVAGAYSETVPGAGRFGPAGPAGLLPPGGVSGVTQDRLIPISPTARPRMRPMDLDVTTGTSGGGGGGAAKTQEDYLQKLQEEAELKLRMIGLSEEEQRRQEIIHELTKRELPIEEERIQKILDTEEALRRATDAEQQREDLMRTVESNIENAMMALVDGSKSVEDAFRDMLRNILMEIYKQAVVQPIASGISDFIGGIFGSANGNAFRSGNIIPFANGGVVSGPTLFPMRGAQTGLMGEAGPEAIMPLKRGKGGKLGVVAESASQPIVINQSFNFSANGDESVKRIIAQEAPKIANLTQKQIIEQRQRGGTMKSVFS